MVDYSVVLESNNVTIGLEQSTYSVSVDEIDYGVSLSRVGGQGAKGDDTTYSFTTSDLTDVDNTGMVDGSILVFDATAAKYVSKNTLSTNNTTIKGGSF